MYCFLSHSISFARAASGMVPTSAMTIMAGFYEPVFDAAGRARLVAESLSFSTMTEDRFQQVYRAVLGVVWNRILKRAGYRTEAEVERVVEELLRFE